MCVLSSSGPHVNWEPVSASFAAGAGLGHGKEKKSLRADGLPQDQARSCGLLAALAGEGGDLLRSQH